MTKYLIDFHWPDGWPSQRYILAKDAIEAKKIFERLYPDVIVDRVLDWDSALADFVNDPT